MALFLVACGDSEQSTGVHEKQMLAMGTIINISIYGETEEKSHALFQALQKRFDVMQFEWSPKKDGALAHLNQALAKQEIATVDDDLMALLKLATTLSDQSEGLFNPAIGRLIDLWGFADEIGQGPPPMPFEIESLLKRKPQMKELIFKNHTVRSTNDAIRLNFGAFAKGYSVDKAIEYLQSEGVNHAIVNAGGDLRAIGSKGELPWVIGIRHPRDKGVIASIEIHQDESLFTSGDYERFYDYRGKRYHHILNPQTGFPADQVTSVTVLHNNAAIADAAATALFVAGPDQWRRIAKKMGITHVMLIDHLGYVHLTEKMKTRLTFIDQSSLKRITP